MAERDKDTLYSKFMERYKSGDPMTRFGAFADKTKEAVPESAKVQIQRQANDSPIVSGAKTAVGNFVDYGELFNANAGEAVDAVKSGVKSVGQAIASPFVSPSNAPLMPGNMPQPGNAPAAQPALAAQPATVEQPLPAAQSKPVELSAKDQKKAVDKSTAEWKERVKKATENQKEQSVTILEKGGVDIEEKFETVAPEMMRFGLTKEEQGWFLMEFGLRLMAEGGKPGATEGGAFGAAGADTLGSVKLHKREQARLGVVEAKQAADASAAKEDTRRWEIGNERENIDLLMRSLEKDLTFSTKLTVDGFMSTIDKKTGEAGFVTGKDGKPLRFESQKAADDSMKRAGLALRSAGQISDRLGDNLEYTMGGQSPEVAKATLDREMAIQDRLIEAYGGGAAKEHFDDGTVDRLPQASPENKGQSYVDKKAGVVHTSNGTKWIVTKI